VRTATVVGPDPLFGGGAAAHAAALADTLASLGLEADRLWVPHPALRGRGFPLDRVEPIRLSRGSRRLVAAARRADVRWVAGPLAMHGYAAACAGAEYDCWAGTTLADENRGRVAGLTASRRLASRLNEPFLRRIERAVLVGARRIYATSPASRAAIEATGVRVAGVLPLPVDGDRFRPEPDDAWLARLERPVLAVVGRASDPRRNVALALAALPLIRDRFPGARLRLIGRPPTIPVPDGVEILGEVPSVADPLREASLLLLTSRQEGFGIAAAESLASGVPVVSTPSGGPEELLRASGGGVVLGGFFPHDLAARAVELLEDVATLTAMRRSGRDYVLREHSPTRLRALVSRTLG